MFTGIVTAQGRIAAVEPRGGLTRWTVECPYPEEEIAIGASIAHAGCCLTVVEKEKHAEGCAYAVEIAAESLALTTLSQYRTGDPVNLERSLKLGDELGGHLMAGHVDGIGTVTALARDGEGWRLEIEAPEALSPLIARKGSIAIDGVSLTVNGVVGRTFGVLIIPHTWAVTTLSRLKPGDPVNLEADILARYVERAMAARAGQA